MYVKWILAACCVLGVTIAHAGDVAMGGDLVPPDTAFSPGYLSAGTLYISGLQGTDARFKLPGAFDEEARNCLDNVGKVLANAGMKFGNLVSVEIYLTDIREFDRVNELYKTYVHAPFPARTTVQVGGLSHGARIEIAAVARR